MAEISIDDILKGAIRVGASDVHLKVRNSPVFRVDGKLIFLKDAPQISEEDMKNIAFSMMNARQREKFEKYNEIDLAYSISGLSRFRVNIFQQRGTLSMAMRAIPYNIKDFFELNLPPVLEKIAQEERGLVI